MNIDQDIQKLISQGKKPSEILKELEKLGHPPLEIIQTAKKYNLKNNNKSLILGLIVIVTVAYYFLTQ